MPVNTPHKVGERVHIVSRYYGMAWLCPMDKHVLKMIMTDMLLQASFCSVPELPAALEVFLLDDARMSKANRQYMHLNGPTNVLSFPGGRGALGTLLLSLDTMYRECLLYDQEVCQHMLRLLAHGMGHLCGMDHSVAMNALCDRLQDHAFEIMESLAS